jgi:hypothetical protein
MINFFNKYYEKYKLQNFTIQFLLKFSLLFFTYIGLKFILYSGFYKYIDMYDIPFPSYSEFDITILYSSFYTLIIHNSFYSIGIFLIVFYASYLFKKRIQTLSSKKFTKFRLYRILLKKILSLKKTYKSINGKNEYYVRIMTIAFLFFISILSITLIEWILNFYYLNFLFFSIVLPCLIGFVLIKNSIKINIFISIFLFMLFMLFSSFHYYTGSGMKSLLKKMNIGGEIPIIINYQKKEIKGILLLETKSKLYFEKVNDKKDYNEYITIMEKKDISNIQIKKSEESFEYIFNDLKSLYKKSFNE